MPNPEAQPDALPATAELERERLAESVANLLLAYHRHRAAETLETEDGQGKRPAK